MKVLFDHHLPFRLAHGGFQVQIEQSRHALQQAGLTVEFLRWWEEGQTGDLIHCFGRPPAGYARLARQKRIPFVFTALHSALGARAAWKRSLHRLAVQTLSRTASSLVAPMSWEAYRCADACIVVTPWESRVVRQVFATPPERIHVVPNGIEPAFFEPGNEARESWLLTTASILPVKRVVETAQASVLARIPYRVAGRPFADNDPYFLRFKELCDQHPSLLQYLGPVQDRKALASLYRQARGFVLLSAWESLSIAALEAAACRCPLLLTDLPWARTVFGDRASYVPPSLKPRRIAPLLQRFHEQAPQLPVPEAPKSWRDVASELVGIYESCLASPSGAA